MKISHVWCVIGVIMWIAAMVEVHDSLTNALLLIAIGLCCLTYSGIIQLNEREKL